MEKKYLGLCAKERILLHLFYCGRPDHGAAPPEATSMCISKRAAVPYKHIGRELKSLKSANLIEERLERPKGIAKKQHVYCLTALGHSEAARIISDISSNQIGYVDSKGNSLRCTIAEARKKAGERHTTCDIIVNLSTEGVFDERTYEYRAVLQEVWRDGVVTPDEQKMLEKVANTMGISDSLREELEDEVRKGDLSAHMDGTRLYEDVLRFVVEDGQISADEARILKLLWRRLGITGEIHEQLLGKIALEARESSTRRV